MRAAAPPLLLAFLLLPPPRARAGDPPAAVRANDEGIAHLLDGRPGEAAARFEEALVEAGGSAIVGRNLAAALAEEAEGKRAARDCSGAIPLLERAVRLHPERLRYRVLLGRVRFEEGSAGQRLAARDDFAWVLDRDPEHLDALINLGQIAYLERRLPEAVALWRRALALRPEAPDVAARLAKAVRELEVEEAYESLESTSLLVRYAPAIPREQAEAVLRLCEEAYGDLAARYRAWPARIAVTLYPPAEFRSATQTHGWVAGLSDGTIRLTVAPRAQPGDLRPAVYHEMAHHFVRARAAKAPVWLHEGLAQLAEGRNADEAEGRLRAQAEPRAAELSAGILEQGDPRLVSRFYDLALGFCRHLEARRGPAGLDELLRHLGQGVGEDEALTRTYGHGRDALFEAWREQQRPR